ncbi:AcrR family transcriptional regulator [Nocardioides marinisabuli]|uniref:AcrR family transcriptional regulator n=1 Tax=Nocardioides marinisabuli TaxID=419476 RepID=A0A7Y9F355_9ACTN|nr:TetR/AcrR family transcriptional regulator [Nocardioides marinisabuli]NYD58782.1 AcrR family transcriptional regulator [Nocardioides marinisabuli]
MADDPTSRPDGRQARWDRHNQERRQRILDAALSVVEAGEPGAEVHVQQIADEAGLSRTVVYRHFADRADLDRAVQAEIVDALYAQLLPEVTLEGTIPQIVERIVATYVSWAVAHPALHRLAEQDSSTNGPGPLTHGIERIALAVSELITTALELLDVELDEEVRPAVDPLVFGLVGAVFSAVRRWMAREEREPSAELMVSLVTDSVWYLVKGHARMLGVHLEHDQEIQALLAQPRAARRG